MTQPSFVSVSRMNSPPCSVPIPPARIGRQVELPREWPTGRAGSPGPDQGYAMRLVRLYANRIVDDGGVARGDLLRICAATALKRASRFGRGPMMNDAAFAFHLWGFDDIPLSDEYRGARQALLTGVSHDERLLRDVVDRIDGEMLSARLDEVARFRELVVGVAS